MNNIFVNYNWGNTNLQHEITTKLCERINIDRIGATVVGYKSYKFIKKQDEINYDPLYCIQDIHNEIIQKPYSSQKIKEFEQKYGVPFLWPAIWADRKYVNYGSEAQKRLIHGWFEFYTDIFDDFDPDIYLTASVDSAYTWIPFRIVNKDHGDSFQKGHTRIQDRMSLQNTVYDSFKDIWDCYDQINTYDDGKDEYPQSYNKAVNFLEEFRNKELSPGYENERQNKQSRIKNTYLWKFLTYWYEKNIGDYKNDFYHESTRKRIQAALKQLYRRKYVEWKDLFCKADYGTTYVYFPLHLQPEATTMVQAPMYMDLPNVIQDISKSLPVNYKLYVKEHPSLYKYKVRSLDYYKEIDDLPNTVLIHPDVSSHELIQNSEITMTVTGTAGFEALMYRKPVITFGKPHYQQLSQVYNAGDPEEIADIIEEILLNHEYNEEDHKELVDYLTAIFECSYPSAKNKHGKEFNDAIDKQCNKLKQIITNHQ